jgi:mono/diheme cytochrome c family protein
MKNFRLIKATLIVGAVSILLGEAIRGNSESERWGLPESLMTKKNPVSQSQGSIAAGQKIFTARCVACHGATGNGDGPDAANLGIHPANLTDPSLRSQPDGALFGRITMGKKPMPAYGMRLSATDRWNLVNYVRTLAK